MRRFSLNQGFTLVELIVTMGLFTAVITIATGALYSAQAVNTRLEQTQQILDGVNLATEVMVRDLRYGSSFYCDTGIPTPIPTTRKSCSYPGGGTVMVFRPTFPLSGSLDPLYDRVVFYLENNILYKREYPYGGTQRTYQVTSTDVKIQRLTFFSSGLNTTSGGQDIGGQYDFNQPLVTVILSGVTVPRKVTSPPVYFSIQTSASSRTLDY